MCDWSSDGCSSDLNNMWFIPFSRFSGLFFGGICLVVLIISGIEALRSLPGRIPFVRPVAVISIVMLPLVVGNAIVDSPGYRDAFRSLGKQPVVLATVFHWAMSSEAMLYNITRPLLKAE